MYRLFYILRQGILLLKESKKAVLISVVFLTIGFITIGSSYIVGERLFSSSLSLKNKINITVFFKNNAEISDIEKTIEEIKVIDGVSGVSAIDKNQAKENFLKLFPQYASLVNSLEQNPFPYTAKVTISNLDMGENIKNLIESFPTVDSVIFSTDTAKKINNLTHMLWFLFTFLLIDLRHSDIKILELIGADRTFIHMPFLIVISVSALLSWVVSIFALNKVDMWSIGVVKSLLPFAEYSMSINTAILYSYLLIFGILISWIGAVIPLRRIR